jgi:hypothetical protein
MKMIRNEETAGVVDGEHERESGAFAVIAAGEIGMMVRTMKAHE